MYFEYQMIFCHISGIGRSRANFPEVVGMFANERLRGSVRLLKFARTWDHMADKFRNSPYRESWD